MKISFVKMIALVVLASVLLSACQLQRIADRRAAAVAQTQPTQAPAVVEPAATAQPTQTPAPAATQTPTQDAQQVGVIAAEQAARAYFAAVAAGDNQQAAGLLSSFSLMVAQMTRGDAAGALQAQKIAGVRWADLHVGEIQVFDAQTILVNVSYTETQKDPATASDRAETRQALWPLRLENGAWLYNWNNPIDFRTLDAHAQTTNNVTVMPVQLNRYSDRIQLILLIQNRSNEVVVFGQKNEILGTFHFGDQTVLADDTQMILNPLRSVPAASLEAHGLFTSYPDRIEIRTWKDYEVDPWYAFQLQ